MTARQPPNGFSLKSHAPCLPRFWTPSISLLRLEVHSADSKVADDVIKAEIPFADNGDSGAVVVNTSDEIVGVIFAGDKSRAYAFPIEPVLTVLDCSLLTSP